jgi:hypothetical protein
MMPVVILAATTPTTREFSYAHKIWARMRIASRFSIPRV